MASLFQSQSLKLLPFETTTELLNLTTGTLTWRPSEPITNEHWKLFVSLIGISTVFLILSCFIFILIWQEHNIHGWIQFSYILSLLAFNIVFIPALLPGIPTSTFSCFILSVLNQYFFIGSKTWLLIISFDILKTLRNSEITFLENKQKNQYILYSLVSFIVPTLFVIVGITLNLTLRKSVRDSSNDKNLWSIFPDYGFRHCRIPTWDIWEYFVFTNCIIHILMFSLIVYTIVKHMKLTPDNIPESPRSHKKSNASLTKVSILILIRLVIVVGLSWTYIAIQDLLQAGSINTAQSWGWHVFRGIFFLQGFFVTCVYLSNSRTIRLIRCKYPKINKFLVWFKSICPCYEKYSGRSSIVTISSQFQI